MLGNVVMRFESYDVNLVKVFFTNDDATAMVAAPDGLVIRRDAGDRSSLIMQPLGPDMNHFLLSKNHDYDILFHGALMYKLCDHHTLLVHRFNH